VQPSKRCDCQRQDLRAIELAFSQRIRIDVNAGQVVETLLKIKRKILIDLIPVPVRVAHKHLGVPRTLTNDI